MNLALLVHVMSSFHFAGLVSPRGNGWTVVGNDGQLLQLVENGVDLTKEFGGSHPLNLEPLAKQQRLFAINAQGHIVKHAEYESRKDIAKLLLDDDGVAKSVSVLREQGLEFVSKDPKDTELVLTAASVQRLQASPEETPAE